MPSKEGVALTLLGLDQQKKSKPWEAMSRLTISQCSQQTLPMPRLPSLFFVNKDTGGGLKENPKEKIE